MASQYKGCTDIFLIFFTAPSKHLFFFLQMRMLTTQKHTQTPSQTQELLTTISKVLAEI